MGLAQDCDDLRNGYVTHRELNERDDDDRMYCCNCQELFDEDELFECDYCGCLICDICAVDGVFCSVDCEIEDIKRNDS